MANVFDNSMTAHEWAHGNGNARSNNGNMFADGRILYSYGRHFPLGVRIRYNFFVINADSYSITTSAHQAHTRRAAHGRVCSVPSLDKIADVLARAANGSPLPNSAAKVRAFFERPEMANRCDLDTIETLLRLVGSKASAWHVNRRAIKAAEKKDAARAKRESERLLAIARAALNTPLPHFDGTARVIDPAKLGAGYVLAEVPTELSRAWKAAKAKGWSTARLKKLRQREKALRANIDRATARQLRQNGNSRKRSFVRRLRAMFPKGRPLHQAVASGSGLVQIEAAAMIRGLATGYTPTATFGISRDKWTELRLYADALEQEAKALRAHVRQRREAYENAHALELWRSGELEPHRLPPKLKRLDAALLRAVDVQRNPAGVIIGGELQTSGGARVPLTHAVRLFRFLKLVRDRFASERPRADARVETAWQRNGERVRVGSFEVDEVYGDGSFKAGCHFIKWGEACALARELGVFDIDPSDEAVKSREAA